jgi:hypothetical protein
VGTGVDGVVDLTRELADPLQILGFGETTEDDLGGGGVQSATRPQPA